MNEFYNRISKYKYIKKTLDDALYVAQERRMKTDNLEYFVSKHCRAYFFEHHLKVEREPSDQEKRDVTKSPIVKFIMSDIQLGILDQFEKRMEEGLKFRQRIMKCRRARVSTIYLAIGYHIIRFNENKKGFVFADRLETSRKLRHILDIFHQNDGLVLRPEIGKKTMAEGLYLHNPAKDKNDTSKDSFILLGSGEQKNTGVSGSIDFMQWSEASLTPDAGVHWSTISPALKGALFDIAESTPGPMGQDEIIYPEFENKSDMCDIKFISWMDVEDYKINDDEKEKAFQPYIDHSLYGKEKEIIQDYNPSVSQMLWRRYKLDEIKNLNSFRSVFPISQEEAFLSNSGLYFHKDLISGTKAKFVIKGESINFSDQTGAASIQKVDHGIWTQYRNVDPNLRYIVSCDIAEGKYADKEMRDSDYSVGIVWKMSDPIEEVCIFRDRGVPIEIFAEQTAIAARYYNNALVIPELNGPGLAFILRLRQLYSNIYRRQKYNSGSYVMTDEYGFRTTSPDKIDALSVLSEMLRRKQIIAYSDIIRQEMSKFAQKGIKIGAVSGHHDDTVTSLWLMAICVKQSPSLLVNETDRQITKTMSYLHDKIERVNDWQYSLHQL